MDIRRLDRSVADFARSRKEKKQSTIKRFTRSEAVHYLLTRPALPRVGKYSVPSGGGCCLAVAVAVPALCSYMRCR